MKRLASLVGLILLCTLPVRALADSHHMSDLGRSSSPCLVHRADDDHTPDHLLQCTVGIAVTVSANGMKVRRFHAGLLHMGFSDETVFETDSGEGVLDGLVAGDYVCVAFTIHSRAMTADLVLFDPETLPCVLRKHRDVLPGPSGDELSSSTIWQPNPVWKGRYWSVRLHR